MAEKKKSTKKKKAEAPVKEELVVDIPEPVAEEPAQEAPAEEPAPISKKEKRAGKGRFAR